MQKRLNKTRNELSRFPGPHDAVKPHLWEVPLASGALDVKRQDAQRRNLVPFSLAWMAFHVVEKHIQLQLTSRPLLPVRSYRIRALGQLHPACPWNLHVHLGNKQT